MLSLIFLIAMLLILFTLSFLLLGRDIFSPTVMICISFLLGGLVLVLNVKRWGVILSAVSLLYIISAIVISLITEMVIKSLVKRKTRYKSQSNVVGVNNQNSLYIKNSIMFILFIFSVLEFGAFWSEVYRIGTLAESYGYHGTIMNNYRLITSHTTLLTSKEMMNTWVTQGFKIVAMYAFISGYTLFNNIILCREKILRNIKYIIPIIIYLCTSFLNASRTAFLSYVIFLLCISYIMMNQKHNWMINISKKFIKIGILSIVIILFLFVILGSYVGRTTDSSAFDIISVYLGAPIYLFSLYLQTRPGANLIFGQETLYGLIKSLYKLGLVKSYPGFSIEFRYYNGQNLGNVYTFLRRPLQDFGTFGLYIVIILIVSIYSYFYYKTIKKTYVKRIYIFLYAYFYHVFPMSSIEFTASYFISLGSIITVLFLVIGFKFLIRIDNRVTLPRRKILKIRWG